MQIPIIPFRGQKKPWGSIPRINWAHPLAANLASYCYDAGGVLIDLVNGGVGSNVTATTAARGVGSFGSGYKYTSGGGAIKLPFTSRINSITPPASIACSFFVTAAPASGVFFVLADSAGDNPIYCAADSDTVMRQGFNSGPGDLTYTVASVINGYHSMVGVGATTALVQAYFDGAFQTSAANNPTATAPGVQPVFNSFNSAREYNCRVYSLWCFVAAEDNLRRGNAITQRPLLLPDLSGRRDVCHLGWRRCRHDLRGQISSAMVVRWQEICHNRGGVTDVPWPDISLATHLSGKDRRR